MRNSAIFLFIMISTFCSCSSYRYIYTASPLNNPYFTQKGESKVTAYYSEGSDKVQREKANGFDLQAAYAISDNFAITTGYLNRRERDIYNYSVANMPFDSSVINYKRNLFEVGGGYFVPVNSRQTITFNLYGGFAGGRFSFDDNGISKGADYNRHHSSDIMKYYFQPSLNFMPGKYFRFGLILRTSFVHYGNIKTTYTTDEQEYFMLNLIANRTLTFIEQEYNMQFGLPKFPWVKLDASLSSAFHRFPEVGPLDLRRNNASIGLTFDFTKMKK